MSDILTNMSPQDEIDLLIVGTIGAVDELVFETNKSKLLRCESYYENTDFLESSEGFIKICRKWGGAAHYFLQGLSAGPRNFSIGVFSALGKESSFDIQEHFQELNVKYYLVKIKDVNLPVFRGVVFNNGYRYWSNKYIDLGSTECDISKYFPKVADRSRLAIFLTQPIDTLISYSPSIRSRKIGLQIFENDIPNIGSNNNRKKTIKHSFLANTLLLNLNERELLQLGRLFFPKIITTGSESSLHESLNYFDKILDAFAMEFPGTLILVGLGEQGAVLAYGREKEVVKIAAQALRVPGAFNVGAGDVAWGFLIRYLINSYSIFKNQYSTLQKYLDSVKRINFSEMLVEFIIGGSVGVFFPDIFVVSGNAIAIVEEDFRNQMNNIFYSTIEDLVNSNHNFSKTGLLNPNSLTNNIFDEMSLDQVVLDTLIRERNSKNI